MSKRTNDKIRIGVSIGDHNGVGLEVIIKTFMDQQILELCTPIVYGSTKLANNYRKTLDVGEFSFNKINNADEASSKKANMVSCWSEEVELNLGTSTESAGK